MMDQIGDWLSRLVDSYGYFGVFVGMLLENIFPPIPSELVLGLSGYLVGRGELNLWLAVASATSGIVVSAVFFYWLGRLGGPPLVKRFGKWFRITLDDLDYTEKWFEKYGAAVIVFGRFLPIIRTLVSLPAGLVKMPFGKFLVLTILPSAVWALAFIYGGSVVGENWATVMSLLKRGEILLLMAATLPVLVWLYLKREALMKKFFPMEKPSSGKDGN